MENKESFECEWDSVENQINNLLKNNNYGDALQLAENKKLIDKQIEIYDKMKLKYGSSPSFAGEIMEKYGLVKKAIEYYTDWGMNPYGKKIKNLKDLFSKNHQEFHESQRDIVYLSDESEENPDTWELIYKIKENKKSVINELSTNLNLENLVHEMGEEGFLKN